MPRGRQQARSEIVPQNEIILANNILNEQYRLNRLIFETYETENAIVWLTRRGLLRNRVLCTACDEQARLNSCAQHIDKQR